MAKDGKIRSGREGWVKAHNLNRPPLPLLRSILWAPDDKNFPPVKEAIVPGLKKTDLPVTAGRVPVAFRSRTPALEPVIQSVWL
jgi:hypothetical protein